MSTSQSKGFKIRRPSSKRQTGEDAADREEVMNLQDLRLADVDNPNKRDNKKCNSPLTQNSRQPSCSERPTTAAKTTSCAAGSHT